MGVFNPLAGKQAYVSMHDSLGLSGTPSISFDVAGVEMKDGVSKVSNFNSLGFQQYISGVRDCKLTLNGPYDEGNTSIGLGGSVTVTIGYTQGVTLAVPGIVESVGVDVKYEDAERVKISVQSTGPFTAFVGASSVNFGGGAAAVTGANPGIT